MVFPDIAVALLKAGLATVRNSTVATALSLPTTTDFTYAMIVANLAALEALLGTTGAHDTIVAAYTNAGHRHHGHHHHPRSGPQGRQRRPWTASARRAVESLYLIQNILGTYAKPAAWGGTGTWAGGWLAAAAYALRLAPASTSSVRLGARRPFRPVRSPVGAALRHRVVPSCTRCTINAGKITKYQCIVPTTWNGSPVSVPTPSSRATMARSRPPSSALRSMTLPGPTRFLVRPARSPTQPVASRFCVLPSHSIRASLARSTSHREVKILKRISIVLALSLALCLAFVGSAYANFGPHGGYIDDTDSCAGCHRAHTSFSTVGWTDTLADRSRRAHCSSVAPLR